jgi:UDP-N-acetylmuramyl tripeptide synthase
MDLFLILIGKIFSKISQALNVGSGSTWPGHIALNINKNFIKDVLKTNDQQLTTILIAGTNGKTTTGKLIRTILEKNNKKVFQNTAGANLLNGIASALIANADLNGKIKKDFAIFEIDENTLPLILKEIPGPDFIVILNLFRDQLDRYGEVNTLAKKWRDALKHLNGKTTIILNADDPQVAFLGEKLKAKVLYFGLNPTGNEETKLQHASDSTYCPNCKTKLIYSSVYFSHLGNWNCQKCSYKHPENVFTKSPLYPLVGIYNEYNINAAVLLAKNLRLSDERISSALQNFKPAFGRQEILTIDNKQVQIFLSKNPTGLNESLKTIVDLGAENLLLVLNDRIPDGRDVSWIWDVDFEIFATVFKKIVVAGDRVFDMGLRLKYAGFRNFQTDENLTGAVNIALEKTAKNETLYILPTYSAMLEVRKILTGKKIL